MKEIENSKAKEYREKMKLDNNITYLKPKDYSGPDSKWAIRHKAIMSSKCPNSELPGNDR